MAVRRPKPRLVAAPASETARSTHWVSPKLAAAVRREKGGHGLFATKTVHPGELLVMWGGDVCEGDKLSELGPVARRHSIQIEEDLYLVPHGTPEAGDYVNHSCDPNAGMHGQTALVATRLILAGEEVCYDYAMSDGSRYDEFKCSCRAPSCRSRITGNDWALAELQRRYAGLFSPYLQRRIDQSHQVCLSRVPDFGPVLEQVLVEVPS